MAPLSKTKLRLVLIGISLIALLLCHPAFAQSPGKQSSKVEQDKTFDAGSGIDTILLNEQRTGKLETLAKIWGFLKYYHPVVAAGELNWDYELFRELPRVIAAQDQQALNTELLRWINTLGPVAICRACSNKIPENAFQKPNLSWLNNTVLLGNDLSEKLRFILDNRNQNENYYVGFFKGVGNPVFTNEAAYNNLQRVDAGYRLLSLFRYWNMIQYLFPYRYAIGEDWNKVLKEFIPEFIKAGSSLDYKLAAWRLVSRVNDTHAGFYSKYQDKELQDFIGGIMLYPLESVFIDKKLVVSSLISQNAQSTSPLKPGDIILSINGKQVDEKVKTMMPYSAASNEATAYRNIATDIFWVKTDSSDFTIERNGKVLHFNLPNISLQQLRSVVSFNARKDTTIAYKLLSVDIGYVNSGKLKSALLEDMFSRFKDTKGLILDMRNYPSDFLVFTLNKYLKDKPEGFAKFTMNSPKYPGLFLMSKPLVTGGRNSNAYKGSIVILVNEQTQSSAEYHAMSVRSGARAIVIGSQTAGADGNVSRLTLPGGLTTAFSGIGVYYPDGRETQRVGIVPDIEVRPTVKGLQDGRDEVLERAIAYIKKGN